MGDFPSIQFFPLVLINFRAKTKKAQRPGDHQFLQSSSFLPLKLIMNKGTNLNPKRGHLDLSIGGYSWAGWRFGSYGKARDWRLLAPDGSTFQAVELASLPGRVADLGYLQALTQEQAAKLAGSSLSLSPDEAALVRVALGVLLRELPVQLGRREARAVPARLLRVV